MPIPAFRDDGWLPVGHHAATWEEITDRFGGELGSQRSILTASLIQFRDALRGFGVSGTLVIDGSYISSKPDPKDFDVLLIGDSNLQERKDRKPLLGDLLDAEKAEKEHGYSLFYTTLDSPVLPVLRDL
ncbi:MAG: hypothetical protein H7145_12980 [Akkermansiaceae bacterium]|nr:hypothetical protein [Armatimonadota bacterium]